MSGLPEKRTKCRIPYTDKYFEFLSKGLDFMKNGKIPKIEIKWVKYPVKKKSVKLSL